MNLNELSKEDVFYCQNMNLSRYLYQKGFRYFVKGKDIKTDSIFSCYFRTPELSKALEDYKLNNK